MYLSGRGIVRLHHKYSRGAVSADDIQCELHRGLDEYGVGYVDVKHDLARDSKPLLFVSSTSPRSSERDVRLYTVPRTAHSTG
jgi:hypothetical protein